MSVLFVDEEPTQRMTSTRSMPPVDVRITGAGGKYYSADDQPTLYATPQSADEPA